MTKWYVALFFVLLGLVGFVGIGTGLSGEPSGYLVGIPALAAFYWSFANRYKGTRDV